MGSKTVAKVIQEDAAMTNLIKGTKYIGIFGPDAHTTGSYVRGTCKWIEPSDMAKASADAVEALKSINTVAWFSITPGKNYLFSGSGLTDLGRLYFETCRAVGSSR